MTLNIIHLTKRTDRFVILLKELENQDISDFKIWEGVSDKNVIKGIALAHKQIILNAKKHNLPNVLIAEDDIKFTCKGAFEFFLKNIPSDYDLYLGGIIYGELQNNNLVTDFSGTMLYLIHERFYDVFLVCNPMVAIQHDGYSDNSQRMMKYGVYVKNKPLLHMNPLHL